MTKAEKNPMGKGIAFGYDAMQRVADQCPDYHPYPYYFMGMIAMERKDFKEAEGHFKRFLKWNCPTRACIPRITPPNLNRWKH
jgi:hypothetical protein